MSILQVENIVSRYGNVTALRKVSLEVSEGEIVTIVGANGAGKTTLLLTLSGIVKPSEGSILYQGKNIAALSPDKIVKAGIAQVPEGRQIFSDLTVLENLKMGGYACKHNIKTDIDYAFEIFPRLKERKNQMGGSLSGGEQQMLAVARALICRPKLLLLDEPSMGLAPVIVMDIFKIIRQINENGTTVILIEQNAKLAFKTAHRGYVLEVGQVVLEGKTSELSKDPRIQKIYLGG